LLQQGRDHAQVRKNPRAIESTPTRSLKVAGQSWQLQTAGKEGVVMISDEQYEQLVGKSHQPKISCSASGNRRWPGWNATWNEPKM